ncbi:MAG TPA: hypothetical protein VG759_17300 [Candidatus Angelobacter sp.]|jgi:hypothetical protein|nr:hypothetical protein [Candidatus Angelobacter sp.]
MDLETALASTVTKAEAIREIKLHDQDVTEFFAEVGDKAEYSGSEVLCWLGY